MDKETIRKTIQAMMEGLIPLNSTWCTVSAIDEQTCKVKIDDLEIEGILLGYDKSDVIVYPKTDTDVLVAFIDNTKTNGAVIMVQETDKIEIMGNANGGLGLTEKIAERLKRLEDSLTNFQTKFNNHLTLYGAHVHTGGTLSGSTGTTVPDTSNVSSENLNPRTNQDYISSTKVTHGEG